MTGTIPVVRFRDALMRRLQSVMYANAVRRSWRRRGSRRFQSGTRAEAMHVRISEHPHGYCFATTSVKQ